jgi:hypothetical protein
LKISEEVGVFKKDAEKGQAKQAAELEKQAAKQVAAEQKRAAEAEAVFRATPRGKARSARENGDGFFEYTGSLAETSRTVMGVLGGTSTSGGHKRQMTSHTDVLAQVEDEGWKLDHVGYVFEPTGTVSRDKAFSSGQTSTTSGKIVGVYLFRADQNWSPPPQAETARLDAGTDDPIAATTPPPKFDTQTGAPLAQSGQATAQPDEIVPPSQT